MAEVDEGDVRRFGRHGFDPALDTMLVFDRDELVAWAEVYRRRGRGDVRPSHRGRGIGSAVLGGSRTRARALGDPEVGQTKTDANAARRGALPCERLPADVDLVDDPDRAGRAAAASRAGRTGVAIRPYRASDARDVHRVIDAAFTEWPGRDPEPYEVWASHDLAHPAFRPDLSPLAFDGDEIVGAVLATTTRSSARAGSRSSRPKATHRRRGIAQAMLRTAFGWFHERGRRVAGVSTDSRTGALGLYEKVGMRVVRQYTRYTKPLSC